MIRCAIFNQKYFMANFYRTLQVEETASQQQIKQSFLNLAKKHHPDVKQISDDEFLKIKTAYDTLKDPDSRKRYDYQLVHGAPNFRKTNTYYYDEGPTIKKVQMTSPFMWSGVLLAAIFCYILQLDLKKMTNHDIRKQNILLSMENIDSPPHVQEKRRKIFMQQMKDKKISTRLVDLKTNTSAKQSTKSKQNKKNCIQSIAGIKKETKKQQVDMSQYM